MNNEKAIWWTNMLFTIQELECVKNGDEQKAAEVKETKDYYDARKPIKYSNVLKTNPTVDDYKSYYRSVERLLDYLENRYNWIDGFGGDYICDYDDARKIVVGDI